MQLRTSIKKNGEPEGADSLISTSYVTLNKLLGLPFNFFMCGKKR